MAECIDGLTIDGYRGDAYHFTGEACERHGVTWRTAIYLDGPRKGQVLDIIHRADASAHIKAEEAIRVEREAGCARLRQLERDGR